MHLSARHLLRLFLFSTTLRSFKRVTFLTPLWDYSLKACLFCQKLPRAVKQFAQNFVQKIILVLNKSK